MEIKVTFPDQPSTQQTLKIVKKVGEGKFQVYHAYCAGKRTNYALKAFPNDAFGASQYQKETILSGLSHPNIIQNVPVNISASQQDHFSMILTEFAKYGDFFEYVVGGVLNSEIIIRTYFHQLIAGLEYMHSQGVAHLDLKLENLMMGSGFNLKIIDFDQAQKTSDKKLTSGGTKGFRAPEVIDGSCTNFSAADIYSAGVILYALRAQEYPFAETTSNKGISLKYYSTFMRENQKFWEMKANQKDDKTLFSESFKQLVNGMLECDVEKRFTLENIKKSKWFNGPVLDGESLKTEMRSRYQEFTNAKRC